MHAGNVNHINNDNSYNPEKSRNKFHMHGRWPVIEVHMETGWFRVW